MEVFAFSDISDDVGFIPILFSDWPILIDIQVIMVITIAVQFKRSCRYCKAKNYRVGVIVVGTVKFIN